jgi:tryptophan halogenase
LFNDTALALQIPYADENSPIASQTISTAQSSGWIWDIGLPTRRGIGYVYSSAHGSDDAAEIELRQYVGAQDFKPPRKLSFNPGYREKFWHRNCVAIGLSAGFIEPLEASALALVELSAAVLSDEMPATREAMDIAARRFNDAFTYRWERVIDFLKMHYVLTKRTDSAFWRDNARAESIPDRLSEQLTFWRHQPPSRYDFHRVEEVFPSASYQYVLYGMGFRTEVDPETLSGDAGVAARVMRENMVQTERLRAGLPRHRDLLRKIHEHGLQPV